MTRHSSSRRVPWHEFANSSHSARLRLCKIERPHPGISRSPRASNSHKQSSRTGKIRAGALEKRPPAVDAHAPGGSGTLGARTLTRVAVTRPRPTQDRRGQEDEGRLSDAEIGRGGRGGGGPAELSNGARCVSR
jgi:hypothetical protein